MVDVVEQADERLVLAPPQRLERAVANLVANALKYSADGTPVEVVVEGTRLEVRDRGRGIADEDLPHVFDRFYRSVEARTEPGSGLGLAIVKQTVERGQGRVWAHARDGGGAVVRIAPPDGGSVVPSPRRDPRSPDPEEHRMAVIVDPSRRALRAGRR
jgi:two-component system, OmpR family, sensor histidine kinase MprB